jgi:hypothetical protein
MIPSEASIRYQNPIGISVIPLMNLTVCEIRSVLLGRVVERNCQRVSQIRQFQPRLATAAAPRRIFAEVAIVVDTPQLRWQGHAVSGRIVYITAHMVLHLSLCRPPAEETSAESNWNSRG